MNEPHYDLYLHEGTVLNLETGEQYNGTWPVVVYFKACDFGDGNGWGRNFFETHGKVLNTHLYDVGSDDQTHAVLVEVPTETDLVALAAKHELFYEEPARL